MNAIGASILAVLGAVILLAPRRWALIALMAGVLYLTEQQAIEIYEINLTALRWLELAGLTRVVLRSELPTQKTNRVDQAVLYVYGYSTLVFLIRSDSGQAQMLGWMIDSILCYFIFRAWLKSGEDLKWFLRTFVFFLAPYVMLLVAEMLVRENPFLILGGMSWGDELRAGRIRCMGSFKHPSLLGTLGAAMLPLYIGLALTDGNRTVAVVGIALCSAIVWLANSGGPINAALVGIGCWLLWVARKKMSTVRIASLCVLVMLALFMKAPIWYLPARVSSLTGGGGWHRSYLMDVAFEEFGKWWFAGMDAVETVHWFPYVVQATGAADITNAYLDLGLKAGVFAVVLFVLLLVRAFQRIGQALAVARRTGMRQYEYLLWGIGCALAVHIVTWLGIAYFDQSYVVWLLQLACVSALAQGVALKSKSYYRAVALQAAGRDKSAMQTSRSVARL